MDVLTVNVGSSSVKLRLIDPTDQVVGQADPDVGSAAEAGAALVRRRADRLGAVVHRVVHGGSSFPAATVLDLSSEEQLELLSALAPLHNPPALSLVRRLQSALPHVAHVACFDTTFHQTMAPAAYRYALPAEWERRWDLRRFGFHGLSHSWAAGHARVVAGPAVKLDRLITAHIGSGASLAAVSAGRSVDTTMGFTPLEGLVMSTRSGSVDPGLILWLLQTAGLSAGEVELALERRSGLLGLSGRSGDLRSVLEGVDQGDPGCAGAYGVYVHRMRALFGAMAAATDGTDAIVFTGGAGQASARLRQDVCAGLGFLGVELDPAANTGLDGEGLVSAPDSPTAVLVVRSREDLEMVHQARRILGSPPP